MTLRVASLFLLAAACLLPAAFTSADEDLRAAPLLKKYCADCHSADSAEAGLDLAALSTKLDDRAAFAKWERIYDRIETREMPPPDSPQPTAEERAQFAASLGKQLHDAHAQQKATVLRRLNRREYQNTLNDLFGTNLNLVDRFPEDGRSHEFDTVGEALSISVVQMQRYLDAADAVLNAAIATRLEKPEAKVVRASYADMQGAKQFLNSAWLHREDGAVVFFREMGYPSGMLRETNVKEDGWYKVRVHGYAFQSDEPVVFALGATTFAQGADKPTLGYFELPPVEPTTVEVKAYIRKNYMIEITPQGIYDGDNAIKRDGIMNYKGPGLAIKHVELEGPIVDEFPSRGHLLLFDGLQREEIAPGNPADRKRSYYVPKFQIVADDPAAAVKPVLARVAATVFRRPVDDSQARPYDELFQTELDRGETIEQALRTTVTAMLCSPDFVYFREYPLKAQSEGTKQNSYWIDDYSLANRLSYFLTRTAPDAPLALLASKGQLANRRTSLLEEANRLLADSRSQRFFEDFTDAWLNLREIDFTNPDGQLYPEFNQYLKHAMVDETRAFFRELIDNDLSVSNLVKSDFAMLNDRLAEHYGVEGVNGPHIRRVALNADSVRGGLLSQASVLKVSANGTNSSPVVRGVWVMERLLGKAPPPPPPGIPGVEPDIRGATTLRELLDKHRTADNCRGCHQQIDPPGFALESFDPIGNWRDRFRSAGDGMQVKAEVRGNKVRYKLGPPVDASGELPDGRKFAGFVEFRDLLAANKPALAKALVSKFLTFATGREMGFSDRVEIERIVRQSANRDYGVRTLLMESIASEIFRRK